VAARWPVLVGWVALAGFAAVRLPSLDAGGGGLGDITSAHNPALVTEQHSVDDFGFPLLSRTLMVQHDPAGLPDSAVQHALEHAAALAQAGGDGPVTAAVPVPGDARLPGVRAPGTTVVTYLFPRPDDDLSSAVSGAHEYAAAFDRQDKVVGVTGTLPARAEQLRIVGSSLRLLEVASLSAVLVIIGVAFGSLVAPLLTLATAALSFVLVTRLAGLLAAREGWNIPADLEPLMVALMVGVITDYVVYFLSGMRGALAEGHGRLEAARRTTATFAPIVAVAGFTVFAGVATLLLAEQPAIRAFGPAMALTVLVALVVSVTAVPAALAALGPTALWPRRPSGPGTRAGGGWLRRATVRALRRRLGAVLVAAACLAGLAVAAGPVRHLSGGLPFVASRRGGSEVARAAEAASRGFVPGVSAPTLLEVRPKDPAGLAELVALQDLLGREPHVAAVLGPRQDATVSRAAGREAGIFVRDDGVAARYLLILDVDPLDATAVAAVDRIHDDLPGLLDASGLGASTSTGLGGDTAAISAVVEQSTTDLTRILVAALVVNLLILVGFLRAIVAPLFLLACTVLSAAATLGLTVLVFQERLGHPGVTFFVPLAAGVLLVALGSDYNLFAVGHVWEEARRRPLGEAMLTALPRSSGAISVAGIALAASLGTLALVPLRQFRELAFALTVGILIDALVVRTLLVPSLLTLFGRLSGWPGHRLDPRPDPPPDRSADVGHTSTERVRTGGTPGTG
jgi:RND superfamily putative drug exporter